MAPTNRYGACKVLLSMIVFAWTGIAQDREKSNGLAYGEVENLRVERRDPGDPEFASVALFFKMKVKNEGTTVIEVGTSTYLTLGVQFRRKGAFNWTQLATFSSFYDDTIKCSSCTAVRPGSSLNVENVDSGIIALKKLWPELTDVEFRLQLEGVCRRSSSGQLKRELILTRPFTIQLPVE